jgi:LmbE family N-acetylglucosaminyl deacetylase
VKAFVLSPHYDDAIWSAGAHLVGLGRDTTIATVFARRPSPGMLTAHDAKCGFTTDSHDAMAARRRENIRACTVVDVADLDGPFGDSQYGDAASEEDIGSWLTGLLRDSATYDTIIAPLGLAHPDHRKAAAAALVAARQRARRIILYEEIPARVWYPEETVAALDGLRDAGWAVTAVGLNVPDDDAYRTKAAAVECYHSQIDRPIRRVLSVPERLWDLQWVI